jgi:Dipeptidyl peptidase IV (DPP IV) N-terminal region
MSGKPGRGRRTILPWRTALGQRLVLEQQEVPTRRAASSRWWARGVAGLASVALLGVGLPGAGLAGTGLARTGLAGTAQASRTASYPGVNGLIAFVRGGNIFTIEPSGAGLSQLTRGAGHSGPRWSPDGQQIAYVFGGDLWIMSANGTAKTRITTAAPGFADSRPSWSPNGRYLAFVKTRRGHKSGYLTRYDTVTHQVVTFSTPFNSEAPTVRQVKVTALPSPVAWGWALDATGVSFGSFIIFEGAAAQCPSQFKFCLEALGFPHQNRYRNGFPSAEDLHTGPTRLLDPDWLPARPRFGTDVLTTQEHCAGTTCTHAGIDLTIGNTPMIPGAYQAVWSPDALQIAYVRNVRGEPSIYLWSRRGRRSSPPLTTGSQPDWQPLIPAPDGVAAAAG